MSRAERRQAARRQRELDAVDRRAAAAGYTVQRGLPGACADCNGTADIVTLSGEFAISDIYHDPGCPAAAGITEWSPADA